MGLWLHHEDQYTQKLRDFLVWAAQHNDTYIVTVKQVVRNALLHTPHANELTAAVVWLRSIG